MRHLDCDRAGCFLHAKFRIGGVQVGYNTCGRHLAYFAHHMSGPSAQDWVPVAPVAKDIAAGGTRIVDHT